MQYFSAVENGTAKILNIVTYKNATLFEVQNPLYVWPVEMFNLFSKPYTV